MPLQAGTRLGAYEIQSPLGAGGMGEVYRARDTKLDRDVAIKILPEAFAHDPERVARFQREAKTLAALNHPNIGGIYGIEDGPAEAGHYIRALVLELVEGPTLADIIERRARPSGPAGEPGPQGPGLPLDEALAIARQIADALEAAHEHGIIHRDLKPANIKVREDGTVKVLDFGLAKALGPSDAGHDGPEGAGDRGVRLQPELTRSPTLSFAATQAGVILGTAAYMAPEQARGKPTDKRADIWAFGCVLYEMLTGRRAFEGQDTAETLAFVMAREPDWSAVPGDVPPAIRTVLRRCLEKNQKKRLADIAAALVLIEESSNLAAPAHDPVLEQQRQIHQQQLDAAVLAARHEAATTGRRRAVLTTTAAVVISSALVAGAMWWATRAAPPRVVRSEITTAGATAMAIQGGDRDLAITPDGSRVIYRGNNQLVVRALDQLEPDVLTGLGAPRGVFVSPDGQWIGFFDTSFLLRKVAMTGGPPVTIGK